MLPIANIADTSLLVFSSFILTCVPVSITVVSLSVYCGGVALASNLISEGIS